ncbi:MAG: 3-oxoacyl-ACP synthase [Bacteroidota bacterium]
MTKSAILAACRSLIQQRIDTIQTRIESLVESRDNETKSSVGDKYETGRAMMQLEIEKSQTLLGEALKLKAQLDQLPIDREFTVVAPGCLVLTNKGPFFISVGLGKVQVDGQTCFCISAEAPIAKALRGKQAGEQIEFNGQTFSVKQLQ